MKHTSLKLSKALMEAGFEGEGKWKDHWDDESNKPFSIRHYDLLWDLCIRYGKEVWGEDENFHRTESLTIFHLIKSDKHQEVEDYILEHSILFNKKK